MPNVTSTELLKDPIGCFPSATVACFDPTTGQLPRRSLDEARTIDFLERLAEEQVPAVLIAASTGHGHLRTVEELAQWIRIAARARLATTTRQLLLRPEDGAAACTQLVDLAADHGYPIVFVRPGRDLPATATAPQVAANMRPAVQAAAARGLAIGIYSIPDVSGLPLTTDAAAGLVTGDGGEHIVAIKVTEADYAASTLQFLEDIRLRHLKIVQGWDPHLARALQDGPRFDDKQRQRCGVTSGPMSLAVFQYLHILAAAEQSEWDEVALAQASVTTLFQSMQDDPRRFADLQRAKFIMGLGHPITAEVTAAQVERVFSALEALPRPADRVRLARSLDLLGDGPFHSRLHALAQPG